MRRKFLFLCLFLIGSLAACKDTKWVDVPAGTPPEGAITGQPGESENPDPRALINCSYIRGDFFELGRIAPESMGACNDLIYLTARPYANGDVFFELPVNDATLTGGASYESSYNGRNGVMKFDGTGKINGGDGLLHSADGGFKQFTFATYIYIDEWVDGAYLFNKVSGSSTLAALQLGAEGKLKLTIGSKTISDLASAALTVGAWHYLALDYNGTDLRLLVDNASVTSTIALTIPDGRADFYMGEGLKGRLDETSVWSIAAGTSGKNGIIFNNWNSIAKVLAYWKYDDAAKPGKDSHTWLNRLESIRAALSGQPGDRKLRLGIGGGQWVAMVASEGARTTFANNVKAILGQYHFDGVDLDFEWPDNDTKYANYSAAIVKLRQVLGKDVFFSVSLHPVSFKITKAAIAAVDFISYQCYGPATMRFSLAQFKSDADLAIAYGIPKKKLIMGVPFFGTNGQSGGQVAYLDMIQNGGLTDPSLDEITYTDGQKYVFNGQNTMREKTIYTCESGLGGIMSWDLATDMPVTDSKSLLKVVKEEIDKYDLDTAE